MEFYVKTLGNWVTVAIMGISNIYLWLLDTSSSVNFLDESMKYVTFILGIASAITYITLVILKKKKEKQEIKRINLEIKLSEVELEKAKLKGK